MSQGGPCCQQLHASELAASQKSNLQAAAHLYCVLPVCKRKSYIGCAVSVLHRQQADSCSCNSDLVGAKSHSTANQDASSYPVLKRRFLQVQCMQHGSRHVMDAHLLSTICQFRCRRLAGLQHRGHEGIHVLPTEQLAMASGQLSAYGSWQQWQCAIKNHQQISSPVVSEELSVNASWRHWHCAIKIIKCMAPRWHLCSCQPMAAGAIGTVP